MHDPLPTTALLDIRAGASAQRAMLSAYVWIVASLVTAVAILGVAWIVAARSDREAGRMIIGAQKGTSYLAVIVEGFARAQARPRP